MWFIKHETYFIKIGQNTDRGIIEYWKNKTDKSLMYSTLAIKSKQ